jgi:hypothetical protein
MRDHRSAIERAAFDVLARWTDEQGRDWHGDLSHGGLTPTGVAWDVFGTRAPSREQIVAVNHALASLERDGAVITERAGSTAPPLYLAPATTEEGVAFCEERVAYYEQVAELWHRSGIEGAEESSGRARREAAEWRMQAQRWREAEATRGGLRADEDGELAVVA